MNPTQFLALMGLISTMAWADQHLPRAGAIGVLAAIILIPTAVNALLAAKRDREHAAYLRQRPRRPLRPMAVRQSDLMPSDPPITWVDDADNEPEPTSPLALIGTGFTQLDLADAPDSPGAFFEQIIEASTTTRARKPVRTAPSLPRGLCRRCGERERELLRGFCLDCQMAGHAAGFDLTAEGRWVRGHAQDGQDDRQGLDQPGR